MYCSCTITHIPSCPQYVPRRSSNWSENQRRRSKKKRKEVIEKYNGICVYCGEEADTIDHFIPLASGGTSRYSNLVASCNDCNHEKDDDVWPKPKRMIED